MWYGLSIRDTDAELAELLDKIAQRYLGKRAHAEKMSGVKRGVRIVRDSEEFWNIVNNSSKPVFVVFTTPYCSACEMYKPFVEEVAKLLGDMIEFVEVDAYSAPEPAWELGVMSTPTTVLFYKGRPVDGFMGIADVPGILEFLAEVLADLEPEVARRARELLERLG